MKRTWDTAELEEHWTLSTDECQAALDNKIEANRLGFALLLKGFEYEGRFPQNRSDLPAAAERSGIALRSAGGSASTRRRLRMPRCCRASSRASSPPWGAVLRKPSSSSSVSSARPEESSRQVFRASTALSVPACTKARSISPPRSPQGSRHRPRPGWINSPAFRPKPSQRWKLPQRTRPQKRTTLLTSCHPQPPTSCRRSRTSPPSRNSETPPAVPAWRRSSHRSRAWRPSVGSGSRLALQAAKRRELDAILVWRLDRWGRSVADLVNSLAELEAVGVAFISVTEALDLTTPAGRAMAAMVAVFAQFEREILKDRVKAGIAQAKAQGKAMGRPRTAAKKAQEMRELHAQGMSQAGVARRLGSAGHRSAAYSRPTTNAVCPIIAPDVAAGDSYVCSGPIYIYKDERLHRSEGQTIPVLRPKGGGSCSCFFVTT